MRTRILAVLTLALAATAGALYLTLTSDHEQNPVFVSAVYLVVVWAFIATAAMQKGPLWWAGNHRAHHRYSDTDRDPHSATVLRRFSR